MVSDSISLPSRGSFHLSLTVLCSLSVNGVFSLRRWSSCLPAQFLVLGGTQGMRRGGTRVRVRGFHPLWPAFPGRSSPRVPSRKEGSLLRRIPITPYWQRAALDTSKV
jgi:hypothetical protein